MSEDTYGYNERLKESRNLFKDSFVAAYTIYIGKELEYNDSWRDRDIIWLYNRLMGEVNEMSYLVQSEQHDEKLYKELADVVNVSLMLMAKITLEERR